MHSTSKSDFDEAGSKSPPLRLIALGDCNTNTLDPLQGIVPDGLVDALNKRGISVEVTNLGSGMTTCREGLLKLQDRQDCADIAILNYGLVDAWMTSIPGVYISYYPDTFWRIRVRKVLKYVKRGLRAPWFRKLLPSGPVVAPDEFIQKNREMIRILRRRNPMTKIYVWGTVPVANNPERNDGLQEFNALLRDLAESEGATYVDTVELTKGQSDEQRLLDGTHLTKATASLIGERIAELYCSTHEQSVERKHVA